MKNYPKALKRKLLNTVSQIRKELPKHTADPKRDFKRNRKLPFETLCKTILFMSGQSLNVELQRQFHYDPTAATTSAFVHSFQRPLKKFCAGSLIKTVPSEGGTGTHCWRQTVPMCRFQATFTTKQPTLIARRTGADTTCCI